jgi:cytochrome c oxidase subunit 2
MPITTLFASASSQDQAIAHLFAVVLIWMAIILLVVAGLVTYVVIVFRRKGEGEPRQVFANRRLEILWTAGPILLLIYIFAATIHTMGVSDPPTDDRCPDMLVIAHQWWWEVRYLKSGIVTANEIHLPVGERVLAEFKSADVIHDFWVPALGRKVDIIPGHPNRLWIDADRAGLYLGTCAEYCGAEHAWMRIRVIAQPPAQFETWESEQERIPPVPAVGAPAAGAVLFRQLPCITCHSIRGLTPTPDIGPDLTHVASRQTLAAGRLTNTPQDLAAWLHDPGEFKPGSEMPNLRLSNQEIDDLVAYLETLK